MEKKDVTLGLEEETGIFRQVWKMTVRFWKPFWVLQRENFGSLDDNTQDMDEAAGSMEEDDNQVLEYEADTEEEVGMEEDTLRLKRFK